MGDRRGEGSSLANIGLDYHHLKENGRALEFLQQGLTIIREIKHRYGESNILTNIGLAYDSLGEYELALKHYQQALIIAREISNRQEEFTAIQNIGITYRHLKQYDSSLDYFQQALKLAQEVSNRSDEITILNQIGQTYQNSGKYESALDYYQKTLTNYPGIVNRKIKGDIFGNFGKIYGLLGKYELALDYLQQALTMNRQIRDHDNNEAENLTDIGIVYRELGQYERALDYHQRALVIRREIGDRRGESHDLTNIGVVYRNLGMYERSLHYHQQALTTIGREIKYRWGEENIFGNLGVVYHELDQYSKALEYFQKALAIAKELGDKRGKGRHLGNLGGIYWSLGQYPKALEYHQQALAIVQELGNKSEEGGELGNLGSVYVGLSQYSEALEYYQQALVIFRETGNQGELGNIMTNLGVVYLILGQYDKAKTHFKDSVTIFESLGSLYGLWKSQSGLAATKVLLKQLKDAIYHYEQALDIIEQLRASLTGDIEKATGLPARTLKTDFMQDKFVVYDELIDLYHDQGDDQKAFETFERKQGRAFLEDMAKSGVRRYVDLPVAISQKEETLETQVEAARKILGEAASKGDEAVKSARELLATTETAQRTFQAELKVKYPRYYALKHPQPVKLPDLQQNILQEGELLLIYNVREKATDLWLVGQQHFQMFSLPMTEAQVKKQVEAFRKWGIDNAITDEKSSALEQSLKKDFTDFTQASHTLYQQLFPATVRTLLGEAQPKLLYIVPTSALYELPFEALVTENTDKPHYLLQDYAISYLSSASLLKTLRDAKQRRGTAQRQPLLAFADPVYPTQDCQPKDDSPLAQQVRDYYALLIGGGLDEESGCPKKLPSEAQSIIKALKLEEDSEPPFLIRGNDASRQTLLTMNSKEQLEGSKYVVFSTHGLVPNKITPLMQPALLLSHTTPLEQEKDENGEMVLKGFLTMSDVFRLKMNTDLVMLSACNTGRGETIKGEGTIGLTRAFMYAGTPAVSITLWSIEAWAAQKLNVAWFTRLKAGQPLADSLREAKLEMLDKSGYYRYPYAWAGVVVFGDGK